MHAAGRDDKVNDPRSSTTTPEKLLALRGGARRPRRARSSTAPSGREALRVLLTRRVRGHPARRNMPGMDGFETAALIRQRKSSEHTPIIFVTAYSDDTHASARLFARRGGLHPRAGRPGGPARRRSRVFVELFRKTAQVRAQAGPSSDARTQLQRLTRGLARDQLRAVARGRCSRSSTSLARDILGAHQAVAVAAARSEERNRRAHRGLAVAALRGGGARRPSCATRPLFAPFSPRRRRRSGCAGREPGIGDSWKSLPRERPRRRGWGGWPRRSRRATGRPIGLLHVLDKRRRRLRREEDEAILTQLAQMTSSRSRTS